MALVADAIVRHPVDIHVGALSGVPGGGSNLDSMAIVDPRRYGDMLRVIRG